METIKCSSCIDYDMCTLFKIDTTSHCHFYRPIYPIDYRTRIVGDLNQIIIRASKLNKES